MTVLLVAIGVVLIGTGCFFFLKACIRILKGLVKFLWLSLFATDSQVDEAYKSEVIAKSPEYKQHSQAVDDTIRDLLEG